MAILQLLDVYDLLADDAPQGWERWRLNASTLVLERHNDGDWHYEVDLERCTTSAEVLDWIMQVAGKAWATPDVLAGLVAAVDDVLHPQATLCSWGEDRRMSAEDVASRVAAAAARWPARCTGSAW